LDIIYEDSQDELPTDSMHNIDSDYSSSLDESLKSVMSSIVDDYNEENEKILLQELDTFLKKDNPKTYNEFEEERKFKIDRVELEFQKFLRKRRRQISLRDAK
jgi:hypothetical protein